MAIYQVSSIYYDGPPEDRTPEQIDQAEDAAWEKCHPAVRKAIAEAVFEWSAEWALEYQQRHGVEATVNALHLGDLKRLRRDEDNTGSSYTETGIEPLRANW